MSDEDLDIELSPDDSDTGMLVLDVKSLPPGSLVTVTIRVGPEPAAAPEPEPTPAPRRYVGSGA